MGGSDSSIASVLGGVMDGVCCGNKAGCSDSNTSVLDGGARGNCCGVMVCSGSVIISVLGVNVSS